MAKRPLAAQASGLPQCRHFNLGLEPFRKHMQNVRGGGVQRLMTSKKGGPQNSLEYPRGPAPSKYQNHF